MLLLLYKNAYGKVFGGDRGGVVLEYVLVTIFVLGVSITLLNASSQIIKEKLTKLASKAGVSFEDVDLELFNVSDGDLGD